MKEICNEHEIYQSTMALLSTSHVYHSTIIEEQTVKLFVKKTPLQIIKSSCLDGGLHLKEDKKLLLRINSESTI